MKGHLGLIPGLGRSPGGGHTGQTTPVFLPGDSKNTHEQRSQEGYGPWGCKELDMTERLSTGMN